MIISTTIPEGITTSEQAQINREALNACAPVAETDCLFEHGYVNFQEMVLRPASETPVEGNIIALVAVILGVLWLTTKIWAGLWGARAGYRHITH